MTGVNDVDGARLCDDQALSAVRELRLSLMVVSAAVEAAVARADTLLAQLCPEARLD